MKMWTLTGVASLCLLGTAGLMLHGQTASGPAAEERKEQRIIGTSGSATMKIKPDAARVFFGVQTIAKTVKGAREDNSARCKKVVDALKSLGIPDLKMKTSAINVDLVYSQARDVTQLPEVLGYRVTNSFSALVSDDDSTRLSANASRVLDTALESGANFVQQIVAFKQDEAEIKRQGMSKAVEDALANARAIADGAKVKILGTFSLNGQPEYTYGPGQCGLSNTLVAGRAAGGETPVIVGDLEITVRVNVTCTY
jgi:uncharacterized protein YggE